MTHSVGISDIQPFLPYRHYQLSQWIETKPAHKRAALARAIQATGQIQMRLPERDDDTVTMAATAIWKLLQQPRNAAYITHIRYIAAGTETSMDNSKALTAYILEALTESGLTLPQQLSTFQVQHACAGGTIALFSLCALLQLSSNKLESGIVVCSDIAYYQENAAAEITQGAGAVALLVSNAPRLIGLDIATLGHASSGVDDFFRPLGSLGARVRGEYSIQCYNRALSIALDDLAARRNQRPTDLLDTCDYIVLHSPFKSMARRALHNLLATHTDYTPAQINRYIEERGLAAAIEPVSITGNMYSASVYFVLCCLLAQQYQQIGADIVGKQLLICSYGSGYTMTVMQGTVMPSAPEIIAAWDIDAILNGSTPLTNREYLEWMKCPYALQADDLVASTRDQDEQTASDRHHRVYLHAIRTDGYREYRFR